MLKICTSIREYFENQVQLLYENSTTLHHLTRGSFREARGSTYFQRNVSKYAHVLGLKLPKIILVRA